MRITFRITESAGGELCPCKCDGRYTAEATEWKGDGPPNKFRWVTGTGSEYEGEVLDRTRDEVVVRMISYRSKWALGVWSPYSNFTVVKRFPAAWIEEIR